ncbi:hypothetical protein F2Q70_00003904 [Brassica cretica]|uniref:Uncharacterized protein n=1 Tax=Brassica cretica TaxID=69181 RepID=A0A8S9J3U0_BRACR|nr:hypothetical protein F2Q70_00003904 [Brassica cretica]
MEFFEEVGSSGNIFPQDVVASSWEYVCQGKHMVLQYMKPVHASRHVEHEVDRPSTRCCDACDQTMRLDMWRTWCLLAWSQAMHPDSTWRRFCSSEERSFLVETSSRPVWTWVYLRRSRKGSSQKSGLGSKPRSTKNCEPLALDCLGWDCNSLSNARLLTPHSLLFQVTSSELVEVAGG